MRRFDLVLLLTLAWFFLAGSALAQKQQKQQQQEGAGESEQDDEEKFNDYEVYGAMDTMKGLKPEAETFYDLLGVDGKSTNEQINRAFRKLSIKYHPDKHGPGTAKMYKLLQFVSTLLQDQKRRARYEWLLHEAPAWHRESVIMARRIRKVTKISLEQSIWITFLLSLAGQFLAQWVAFAIAYGRIMQSRRTLRSMGDKEVKRIRKKLESGDAAFIAYNNSDAETVLLADSPRPPFPTPLDLFVFAIPIGIVRKIFSLIGSKKTTEKSE